MSRLSDSQIEAVREKYRECWSNPSKMTALAEEVPLLLEVITFEREKTRRLEEALGDLLEDDHDGHETLAMVRAKELLRSLEPAEREASAEKDE